MREDADAKVGERALADPSHEVGLHVGHRPYEQRGDEERDYRDHEHAGVVGCDPVVDRVPREQRRRERRGGADEQRDEREQTAAAVGTDQAHQPAEVPQARAATHSFPTSDSRRSALWSASLSSGAPRSTSSR